MVTEEEFIQLWGEQFFKECKQDAEIARLTAWEIHRPNEPLPQQLQGEVPVNLVLAAAIKRLMKI